MSLSLPSRLSRAARDLNQGSSLVSLRLGVGDTIVATVHNPQDPWPRSGVPSGFHNIHYILLLSFSLAKPRTTWGMS